MQYILLRFSFVLYTLNLKYGLEFLSLNIYVLIIGDGIFIQICKYVFKTMHSKLKTRNRLTQFKVKEIHVKLTVIAQTFQ